MMTNLNEDLENDVGIDLGSFSIDGEIARFKSINLKGWNVIVRLYMTPRMTKGGILLTGFSHDMQQYRNCIGLVVGMSESSYKDERYKNSGPWCKVGDWVGFPRHSGYKIRFEQNIPFFVLKEDGVDFIVDDPTRVTVENETKKEDIGIDLMDFSKEEEIARFKGIRPVGWNVILRLYSPKRMKGSIHLSDNAYETELGRAGCVGLVVGKSKDAYQDERYKDTGHWCELADWVCFAPHLGYRIFYDGLPAIVLKEDMIDAVLEDPAKVSR